MDIQQIQNFIRSIQPIKIKGVFFTYMRGEAHLYADCRYCERCLSAEDEGNCACQEFEVGYNPDYTEEMECHHKKMAQQINIDANELIVAAILVGSYQQSIRQIDPELERQEIDFLAPLISQYNASYHDLMGVGLAKLNK